jgi:hypothetical protein
MGPVPPWQLEHGLLGRSYDWQGRERTSTPEEIRAQYGPVAKDQLPRLLYAAMEAVVPAPSRDITGKPDAIRARSLLLGAKGQQEEVRDPLRRGRCGRWVGDTHHHIVCVQARGAAVRRDLLETIETLHEVRHQLRSVEAAIARAAAGGCFP